MQTQAPVTVSPEQQAAQARHVLEARARNGVNWFFWIAGLSIINTIIFIAGGNITFILGLGATQFVDGLTSAMMQDLGANSITVLRLASLAVDIGLAGIFVVAGLLSRKKYRWAIITGMVLYVADAILFIWAGDWFAVAFHALALWGLWGGLRATNALRKLASAQPAPFTATPVAQDLSLFRSDILRILGGSCAAYVGILVVLSVIGYVLTR